MTNKRNLTKEEMKKIWLYCLEEGIGYSTTIMLKEEDGYGKILEYWEGPGIYTVLAGRNGDGFTDYGSDVEEFFLTQREAIKEFNSIDIKLKL